MGSELVFLLLPVAAFSGWLIGRRPGRKRERSDDCFTLSRDYFKGLNYLLNEQADKALEVFIQMSEVDSETIDLHFALANLFLKRGEVERAIRIHQNLIARPMLTRQERNRALFELGRDYMRAGLLDRAETLFMELREDSEYGAESRSQLLDIYQQEKEWGQAVQIAQRLGGEREQALQPMIAQFYCELAGEALSQGDTSLAQKMVKRSHAEDRNCVRATLLEADIALRNGQAKVALKALKRVEQQDGEYLPLILEPLRQSYEQLGRNDEFIEYLQQLVRSEASAKLVVALADQLRQRDGDEPAMKLLAESLRQRPSLHTLRRLLEMRQHELAPNAEMPALLGVLDKLLEQKPIYHCTNCGFTSKSMQWQCPSCRQWNRVKPIHGIEGD